MSEKRIKNLSEYVSAISEYREECIIDGLRKHEQLLFRGQSADWPLLPAIGRDHRRAGQDNWGESLLDLERKMIDLAKLRLPDVFKANYMPIELLALLQHYGIPTRLLDVTENALVALYFACANDSETETDAYVYVFKENKPDYEDYGIMEAVADTYRFCFTTLTRLTEFFNQVIEQPYFLKQKVSLSQKTEKQKIEYIKDNCSSPFLIYAPFRSPRQIAQSGRYFLFPNSNDGTYFLHHIKPIPEAMIEHKLTIAKENRAQLLKELACMGITQASLFPDSVEKACQDIVATCKEQLKIERKK